jgi:hypothetical protein
MSGTFSPWLVILSYVAAVFASYVALALAQRVTESTGKAARYWLIGGAAAMGTGIWCMHFIGMLAFSLGMRHRDHAAVAAGRDHRFRLRHLHRQPQDPQHRTPGRRRRDHGHRHRGHALHRHGGDGGDAVGSL